jgi:hypothetical protein
MKIDKSILQAFALGIALSTTVACSKDQDELIIKEETPQENCEQGGGGAPDNCPACGMG